MSIRFNRSRVVFTIGLALLMVGGFTAFTMAADSKPALYATWVSVLPPVVAIALALITKEVYSSLFLGVLTGAVAYAGANFSGIVNRLVRDGIVASLSDSYNMGILVFLVVLGMMVAMMNLSGGSKAFGQWARTKIKTRQGAEAATILLGILIFVDDYFNCLTVGSVMKPLTDEYRISRAKLAYLIDATAAPVCILAPISSWAAAVSGFVKGENGLTVFIQAIPFNFYAILTIVMMFSLVIMNFDYSKMAVYERNAIETGDLFTVRDENAINAEKAEKVSGTHGKVIDLVFPVIVLIICCVIAMVYTGGFFSGTSFVHAFANCDAAASLSMGSMVALLISIIFYTVRGTISFRDCMGCIPEGFKSMVSPILVLTLAWSLKVMTDGLGLAAFISNMVSGGILVSLFPALIFLIACGLGIASGTSWGTFGILIPIALAITEAYPDMTIIVISACLAGGVCGDHCSPISDTTIMSSAGAACNHISHVETQMPYAMTVMCVSAVTYLVAGFTRSALISLPVGIILMIGTLFVIRRRTQTAYLVDKSTMEAENAQA
ncbi:MAG: Na+/H+ antiporter NhaC family protein [Mobilibacterium timonense]|uniref:Na+/H+ antiporter NhaC family protein n=1 Tax=Mobilibacterium timonense TaxID=1871012 RepID=UPI002356EEB5|nr:Na+/H+ antiporter NhaC family protein [Mobilibacterium timonense]MBM6991430.1 Na+/H+ antiporter NhaC family protein [Mobilibacterium timonense]